MARGPFQVDPNSAREITPVSQQGGVNTVVPASDLAAPVSTLVGTIAQQVAGREKTMQQEDLRGKLGAVQRALQAGAFPDAPEGHLVTAEGQVNPTNVAAIKELERIKNAALQGKLPQFAAVERANVLLNEAVSASPEWREELTAVARETMGYTPQVELTRQVFALAETQREASLNAQKEEQKALNEGFVSLAEKRAFLRQRMITEVTKQGLEEEVRLGKNIQANAVQHAALSANSITSDILLKLQTAQKNGQAINAQEQNTIMFQAYSNAKKAALEMLPPGTDPAVTNQVAKTFDDQYNFASGMIGNSDALKVFEHENKTFKELALKDAYANQKFGRALAIGGPQMLTAVANAYNFLKDNPNVTPEVAARLGIEGMGLIHGEDALFGNIMAAVDNSESGSTPQNTQVRQAGGRLGISLALAGKDPVSIQKALHILEQNGITKDGSRYGLIKWSAEPRVAAAFSENKANHEPLRKHYNAELGRLMLEYTSLVQSGKVPPGGMTVSNGKVIAADGTDQFAVDPQASKYGGTQTSMGFTSGPHDSPYEQFYKLLRKVNNLNEFGRSYNKLGVMNEGMWDSPEKMVAKFTDAKLGMENAPKETQVAPNNVTEVRRDPVTAALQRFDAATSTWVNLFASTPLPEDQLARDKQLIKTPEGRTQLSREASPKMGGPTIPAPGGEQ